MRLGLKLGEFSRQIDEIFKANIDDYFKKKRIEGLFVKLLREQEEKDGNK